MPTMKPFKIDGSVKSAIFTLMEGLIFICLGIAVNHSFFADVEHDKEYPLGKMSLDILKIKTLFNQVSVAFFAFLCVASVLPPTAVRKGVPFFYAIYILLIMVVAMFMIAGIAVYTALYLNIIEYDTKNCIGKCARVFENRRSGTLAMMIIYAGFFFFHCICTAYSIYHYFTWRVNMQRWSYDMEPSAMHYHHGMVNASYMHDRPPMDPRYFWPPPPPGVVPPGAPGLFRPPPGYYNPFHSSSTMDEKPTRSGTQHSDMSTSTEASTNTESLTEPTGAEGGASGGASTGACGGTTGGAKSAEELSKSSGESSTQTAPMENLLD